MTTGIAAILERLAPRYGYVLTLRSRTKKSPLHEVRPVDDAEKVKS